MQFGPHLGQNFNGFVIWSFYHGQKTTIVPNEYVFLCCVCASAKACAQCITIFTKFMISRNWGPKYHSEHRFRALKGYIQCLWVTYEAYKSINTRAKFFLFFAFFPQILEKSHKNNFSATLLSQNFWNTWFGWRMMKHCFSATFTARSNLWKIVIHRAQGLASRKHNTRTHIH